MTLKTVKVHSPTTVGKEEGCSLEEQSKLPFKSKKLIKEIEGGISTPTYLTYEDYPIEDLLVYAGIDCLVTSELLDKLTPIITEKPKYKFFENGQFKPSKEEEIESIAWSYDKFTRSAQEFLIDLELNGFLYDVGLNKVMKLRMEAEILDLEAQIFSSIGKTINLDSGVVLGDFLYVEKRLFLQDEEGNKVVPRTKTGEPSTDGEALEKLSKTFPEFTWLSLIAKRNDISSLYRTFVVNYVEDYVKADGRIHPSYNLFGTGSFRISGEEPNLTQLPNIKHGYNIREMFKVPERCVFLAADYSSAEVKILGALCRDEKLLQAIAEGKDFHSYSASEMHGIDYEEMIAVLKDDTHPKYKLFKMLRQGAKALSFSILYGSSDNGIAFSLGILVAEAIRLKALYFDNFPGIKTYVTNTHNMALANGYVFSPFMQRKQTFGGRDCFLGTPVYNGAKRLAQNVRVQNASSSFGLYNFAQLNNAIKPMSGRGLCNVYDSFEMEIPIPNVAQAIELTFLHLEDNPVEIFDWLTLPVTIDVEIGFNWGNTKHVKRGITQEEVERILEGLRNEN